MQQDFAKMLGETLTKIKSKIEQANKSWEEEQDSKMLKGYEQIANKSSSQ